MPDNKICIHYISIDRLCPPDMIAGKCHKDVCPFYAESKECFNCLFAELDGSLEPCLECENRSNWKPIKYNQKKDNRKRGLNK